MLDYLDKYDILVTPTQARCVLNILRRIDPQKLLVSEVLVLNSLADQLERISNE